MAIGSEWPAADGSAYDLTLLVRPGWSKMARMRRWILPMAVTAAMICVSPSASAHHSIASAYDSSREITLEGVITEFHFVYPHPFVTIEVKQGSSTAAWALEMDNRSEMAQAGVTAETLKPGDRIVVKGNPGRMGRQALYIQKLDRPSDGFGYQQVGNSPRIRKSP